MALAAGSRLGPYDIAAQIGTGGMGEVYRARDTRLKRDVAIKILPPSFASDPDRLARFQREAEVLASLSHPNIAGIYGLEESDGIRALVMELVEGETLADRIARQPIPLDEALPIAKQIAEALEAAHEQGIIHRDLKPANIKVRPDGSVKVLDFGLAKLSESPSRAGNPSAMSMSPTITSPAIMTGVGVLLGTAPYMAPEQAKGRPADKRSDIWAFGCVLYEMLTGRRAFQGDDVVDTLAAVLRGEPDWSALPRVPATIRVVLQRCLDKDRRRRIADISTVRFVVDEPTLSSLVEGALTQPTASPQQAWRRAVSIVAAAIVASAATGVAMWTLRGGSSISRAMTRFQVPLEDGQAFGSNGLSLVAISPNGSRIAYAALSPGDASARNIQRLYVRSMSEDVARPILSETQGVIGAPVFSPDGQTIAFYTGASANANGVQGTGKLKTVSANGGTAVTLADIELPLGMNWNGDSIVVGQPSKGIVRIPATGGEPEQIVVLKDGEIAQGPQLLPGRRAVLFTLAHGVLALTSPTDEVWDKADIVVQSLGSGERKTLIQGGSDARYLPSGHLVYASAGTLRAVAFDADGLRLTGKPALVLEGIRRSRLGPMSRTGSAHFSVSETGSLVYLPGPASVSSSPQTLAFFDRRTDAVEHLKVAPAMYEFPRISPDGHRVAVGINNGKQADVWLYDLSGSTAMRQLTSGGKNRFPIWSADGQHVAFQSDREGDLAIFWQRTDGTAPAARLTKPDPGSAHIPDSWSPRDDKLFFDVQTGSTFALWTLSLPDGKIAPFGGVHSGSFPPAAEFSPDGRWVAYQSGELPAPRIFVQPLPISGVPIPIANGRYPYWSRDGKQLFYQSGGRLFAVAVNTDRNFTVGNPSPTLTQLLEGTMRVDAQSGLAPGAVSARNYDLTPDGNRALGTSDETPLATAASRYIEVVVNWVEELKARIPPK